MKRSFDIFLSILSIVILLIPFLILIILLKLSSNGNIFHWSKRIGKNSKIFLMPKFRTMKKNTPNVATHLLNNPQNYLTNIGSYLRKYSLDEIPQIYSIIKGDMSFVGPRPALYNQFDLISKREKLGVNKIKPGVTGWAQINGRDQLSIDEKVRYDFEYLSKKNFLFDTKILFLTILRVFRNQNISH